MKRLFVSLCIAVTLSLCVFMSTVQWAMTHVEIYTCSDSVTLSLCGYEWAHRTECGDAD